MMKQVLVFLFMLATMSSCATSPVYAFGKKRPAVPVEDLAVPIQAGDRTGVVEGCGQQPVVGFTYCRMQEGPVTDKALSFIGPPAQCSRADACVFIKVFDEQGQVAWGGQIPKGQTRVTVSWSTLLGCKDAASCQLTLFHRGFWSFVETVQWTDKDGNERTSATQGDVLLRVLKADYIPLNAVEADPNFVWQWTDGGYVYRMTSSLRAFVGKVQP